MLTTKTFSRFRKIPRNRFSSDTHIKHNAIYTESIFKDIELSNNTKKNNNEDLQRWVNSLENEFPYWVAKFRPKQHY